MDLEYLSEEEQYKETLNRDEISRIKDRELREIREKYWSLQHQAFLDEKNIPDKNLEQVYRDLKIKEKNEILQYRKKKNL